MKYNELIKELEYCKEISGEENPEIVIVTDDESFEIDTIDPALGIENDRAIGIYF